MNIAVVGATGLVGSTMIRVLQERVIKYDNIYLYASGRSAGKQIMVNSSLESVIELKEENITNKKIDIALFSAGAKVSQEFAKYFVAAGAYVIDNSSAFRRDSAIPLVIPEINASTINDSTKIIANPNCTTIISLIALNAIEREYGIDRLVFSSYQAISGAGQSAIDEFRALTDTPKKLQYRIDNSLIPHIDVFLPSGYTKEEQKMVDETRKILRDESIGVSATCVRVPIENCHCISINVKTKEPFEISRINELLRSSRGLIVYDDVDNNLYPMPRIVTGKDEVFVGRVRIDDSFPQTLNMFVCGDNIRKGAATNAVQIAQHLISEGLVDEGC